MNNSSNKLRDLAPPMPRTRVLFGGTALVMSIFALYVYALDRRLARKDARGSANPGVIPSWEYRMWRARFPADILHTHERSSDSSYAPAPDAHDLRSGGNEGGESPLARAYRTAPETPEKSDRAT
ncbi:hypothetical protein V8B97DRAFT_994380 [Scleroderma yunnanense]